MVGKKNPSASDKRPHMPVQPALASRPKRQISPKSLEYSGGLSWREERELKKALHASLQDFRRLSESEGDPRFCTESFQTSQWRSGLTSNKSSTVSLCASISVDESSQASSISSTQDSLKNKIHAQRKFAQGASGSNPGTPSTTPIKVPFKSSPIKLFPKRAKTEDFLTFLCLRGTSALPSHLDFFNFSREEPTAGEASGPHTPKGFTRESSPASSSTSVSNNHEDVPDIYYSHYSRGTRTPNRKAARASASTPEGSMRSGVGKRRGVFKLGIPSPNRGRPTLSPANTPLKITRSSAAGSPFPPKLTPIKTSGGNRSNQENISKRKAVATLNSSKLSGRGRKSALLIASKKSNTKTSGQAPKRGRPCGTSKLKVSKDGSYLSYKGSVVDRRFKKENHRQFVQSKKSRLRQDKHKQEKSAWESFGTGGRKRKDSDSTWEDMNFENEFMKSSPPKRVRLRTSNRLRDSDSMGHWKEEFLKKQKTSKTGGINKSKKDPGRKKLVRTGPRTRSAERPKSTSSSAAARLMVKRKLTIMKRLRQNPGRQEQILLAKLIEKKRKQNDKKEKASNAGDIQNKDIPKKKELKYVHVEPQSIKFEPFPQQGEPAQVVEIPIFYPSEEEFSNPMAYIQKITPVAEPYGMCKLVPPPSWKLDNKMNEELRMISQTQYTHKLFQRWGPNVQQVECLRRHLQLTGSDLDQVPVIGGVEVDLPKLYSTIQEFGGMQNCVDKKRWIKVADAMKIPKLAQDRGTKLYDAYCKYLLSYDMLSEEEKNKLEQWVVNDRQRKEKAGVQEEEWITKGKSLPLSAFSRAARNTHHTWSRDSLQSVEQIESDYWKIVEDRECHVSVQYGYMHGSLFTVKKDSPYSKHPWNLLNLSQDRKSLLHCLGPIEGVTIPTVQLRMLFTSTCWTTDHHRLPYIHYMHSGSEIIWYSVPKQEEDNFRYVLNQVVPSLDTNSPRWLKEDVVTVSPGRLVDHDVSVGRCVQHPRQFLLVFPKTYTATVSCGYSVSELVHYATADWIPTGQQTAEELSSCNDRELFSMDALLTFLIQDKNVSAQTLAAMLPTLELVIQRELAQRKQLQESGLKMTRYMWTSERRKILLQECTEYYICEESKKVCFFSMVVNEAECTVLALDRGLSHIQKKRNLKSCKLIVRYTDAELNDLVRDCQQRITSAGVTVSAATANSQETGVKKKPQRKSEVKT